MTESTVKKKLSLVPGGIVPEIGEEARVDADDALAYLEDSIALTSLISTRQEPIASAVYLQKIATVEEDDNRRDSGASEIRALPMKEYSGGGES